MWGLRASAGVNVGFMCSGPDRIRLQIALSSAVELEGYALVTGGLEGCKFPV